MTQIEIVDLLKESGVWDEIGYPTCIDNLIDLVAAYEREKQAEQEPVAWMWACTECGTEAEDGTDGRICSSCGYHKFYKAPKDDTCVCAAKTQEKVKQEPVAWGCLFQDGTISDCICPEEHDRCEGDYNIPLYAEPVDAKAIRAEERKRTVEILVEMHRKANGEHNYYHFAANEIQGFSV